MFFFFTYWLLCSEHAWDIDLPESDGHAFVDVTTNPAYKAPPTTDGIQAEEGQPHVLTTGMGGARHMERLSRLRALKKRRE